MLGLVDIKNQILPLSEYYSLAVISDLIVICSGVGKTHGLIEIL